MHDRGPPATEGLKVGWVLKGVASRSSLGWDEDGMISMTDLSFSHDHPVPEPIAGTAFGKAYEAGVEEQGERGPFVQWYPDLQLSVTCQSIVNDGFFFFGGGSTGVRLACHVMLVGPPSLGKSSGTNAFLQKAAGCVTSSAEQSSIAAMGDERPPLAFPYSSSGTTWAAARGGISEGKLVTPLFGQADYIISSELFELLGEDEEVINKMNQAIEEGQIRIRQVQIREFEPSPTEQEKMEELGMLLDAGSGEMTYQTQATFITGTRPEELEEADRLDKTGFRSRLLESVYKPTDSDIKELMNTIRTMPEDQFADLLPLNQRMRKVVVTECERPPKDLQQEVLSMRNEAYEEAADRAAFSMARFTSGRDGNIVCQALAAAAYERQVRENRLGEGDRISIEPEEEDLPVAKWFFLRFLENKIRRVLSNLEEDEEGSPDLDRLVWLEEHLEAGEDTMESSEAIDLLSRMPQKGHQLKQRAAYNFFSRCSDRGWMEQPWGEVRITEKGMRAVRDVNDSADSHSFSLRDLE